MLNAAINKDPIRNLHMPQQQRYFAIEVYIFIGDSVRFVPVSSRPAALIVLA
jgi:hypothetical protein